MLRPARAGSSEERKNERIPGTPGRAAPFHFCAPRRRLHSSPPNDGPSHVDSRQAEPLGRSPHALGERRRHRDHGRQRHAHLQRVSPLRASRRDLPAESVGRARRSPRGSRWARGSPARGTGTSPRCGCSSRTACSTSASSSSTASGATSSRAVATRATRRDAQVLPVRAEGPPAPGQAQRAAEAHLLRHAGARHHARAERAGHLEARSTLVHHGAVRELQVGAVRRTSSRWRCCSCSSLVHVFMVFTVDPYSLRAIITGWYDRSRSPEARNARPFFHLFARGRADRRRRPRYHRS